MSAAFEFQHRIDFLPEDSAAILRSIPAAPGIVALRGAAENAEPYLTRAADIRRRLRRLLAPPEALNPDGTPVLSRRLNLRDRVRCIEYTATGSDFESMLTLYRATRSIFGPEQARKRLRLHPPYFLRITTQHRHPRVYATNRLSKKSLAETFGPFPSRAAAERYCDAVLDLFKLRRCHEDLQPFPEHPGCAYGEMNKCLAPCKQACTAEQYAEEARSVFAFFATHGDSMLNDLAAQRDAASEALDFERAAALHTQWEKIRSAAQQADDLVRPVTHLRALILQPSAPVDALATEPGAPFMAESHPAMSGPATMPGAATEPSPTLLPAATPEAALFLLDHGRLCGPVRLSTLGVRAVREQTAVGSSLFAQPLMLAPIPLAESHTPTHSEVSSPQQNSVILSERAGPHPAPQSKDPEAAEPASAAPTFPTPTTLSPEDRARAALTHLSQQTETAPEPDIAERCDYLSLFRRWYYRPEKQRQGEVFLPNGPSRGDDSDWPYRRILNAAARVTLGPPTQAAPVDREKAREASILSKRSRQRKTPTDLSSEPQPSPKP